MGEIKTEIKELPEGSTRIAVAGDYLITGNHTIADIIRWVVDDICNGDKSDVEYLINEIDANKTAVSPTHVADLTSTREYLKQNQTIDCDSQDCSYFSPAQIGRCGLKNVTLRKGTCRYYTTKNIDRTDLGDGNYIDFACKSKQGDSEEKWNPKNYYLGD